jgi:hypothetical protein
LKRCRIPDGNPNHLIHRLHGFLGFHYSGTPASRIFLTSDR